MHFIVEDLEDEERHFLFFLGELWIFLLSKWRGLSSLMFLKILENYENNNNNNLHVLFCISNLQ